LNIHVAVQIEDGVKYGLDHYSYGKIKDQIGKLKYTLEDGEEIIEIKSLFYTKGRKIM